MERVGSVAMMRGAARVLRCKQTRGLTRGWLGCSVSRDLAGYVDEWQANISGLPPSLRRP